MIKIARKIERIIIHSLIIMMGLVLILATVELGYKLLTTFLYSEYLLLNLNSLMDLFGVFLLVLIGIELLDTIKIYLKENVVHVEVVVLVAIIALARKVVVLKLEEWTGGMIAGLGALIIALAVAYYLIKRAGLFKCDMGYSEKKLKDVVNDIISEEQDTDKSCCAGKTDSK